MAEGNIIIYFTTPDMVTFLDHNTFSDGRERERMKSLKRPCRGNTIASHLQSMELEKLKENRKV